MARKAVAQELSRERILTEARELFATFGYRALTMRSIAKAMGYSHGALYYHFSEKAELFYALIKDDFASLLQRQRELIIRESDEFSVNLLQKLMMEFVWFGLSNPNHYEMMFMINEPELQQYSRTEQAQCLDMFAVVIREVLTEQPGVESRRYTLPWNIFMSLHGFISYCIQFKLSYEEARRLAEEHVRLICISLDVDSYELQRPIVKMVGNNVRKSFVI
ncbi:TetR/AcrR family transcriptional regulator [Paenibacillus roseipurpureus]|uniref:TetR/AcrR family transcriptional regulator n=1 Tax=Paenibacillus roseopurpureus TaxID=2918901 RepID=A0AA96LMD1_9BACL|nr:TetR/AcrR family transcriptional regulator [Paenibacillus sp. MBLB1832]WNR43752.1 TetR/AcrR family transcriptional regulator [Paenibacillus sp. MBLB1832]